MRITIKDIAAKLNIHHSTVSRALRMDPKINQHTGEMIRQYAKEHGYYVNLNALKLRGDLRNMIALIVPNINHRFFLNIIYHLTNISYENNYVLSIYQSNENFDHERSIIRKLIQQDVAGVIVSVSGETRSSDHFRELNKIGIPLVFFDRVLYDVGASRVTANNREIAESLVNQLISMGRNRIAHVTGPDHINVLRDRNMGYHRGVENHGAEYAKQIIIKEAFSLESGYKAAAELFSGKSLPDAIISTSFVLTMGIVNYLNKRKILIPGEVAIAGFGDSLFNSLLHSEIISVEQPAEEMALTAFRLLLDQMKFKGDLESFNYQEIELKSEIIIN